MPTILLRFKVAIARNWQGVENLAKRTFAEKKALHRQSNNRWLSLVG